jgi:hypothetical protein
MRQWMELAQKVASDIAEIKRLLVLALERLEQQR